MVGINAVWGDNDITQGAKANCRELCLLGKEFIIHLTD